MMSECKKCGGMWLGILAVFLVSMGYDMYIHSTCLKEIYEQTPKLWRPQAEMQALGAWCFLYHGVLAFLITSFYSVWRSTQKMGALMSANCPVKKSVMCFGLWLGMFTGTIAAAGYIWLPISVKLAQMWFLAELGKGILIAIVLALVYNRYEAK